MQAGHDDALILPAPPEPFALVAGSPGWQGWNSGQAEASFRRMGLRPEPIGEDPGDARIAAPSFRLRFASFSILAGRAADDALDLADPRDPSTSLLAASLPGDWRAAGDCWLFVPENTDAEASIGARPTQMREFFKMMVLLIDLFDASHIFWSPARLWSDALQFREAIAEMLVSGMPPVLHLIAFRRSETGEGAFVRTRGLALFGGQEIEGRIPEGWTVAEMVKRLARLALDIILNGSIATHQRLRGLEPGEWMSLLPLPDGRDGQSTVRVEFGSDL